MTTETAIRFKSDADIINDLASASVRIAQLDKRNFEQKLEELRSAIAYYIAEEFDVEPKQLPYKMKKLLDQIGTAFEMTQLLLTNLQYDIAHQTGHALPDKEDMADDEIH